MTSGMTSEGGGTDLARKRARHTVPSATFKVSSRFYRAVVRQSNLVLRAESAIRHPLEASGV